MRAPRRTLALVALALFLAPALSPAEGAYGPSVVGGTSSNSERKLAVAPNGTIFATYTEPVANTTGIAVKFSSDQGRNWSALPRLGTAEAFRSCIAVDSHGVLHIAWTEFVGPDRQVFYARWEGGPNWTGLVQLSDTPGYSGFPSLAIDGFEQVSVVWYGFDGAHYQVFYRRLAMGVWSVTYQATHGAQDANNPALVVADNGTAYVAYFSYVRGEEDVWFIEGLGPSWSAPLRINPQGVPSRDPSIVLLDGAPAIAYAAGENNSREIRIAQRGPGGAWADLQVTSGDLGPDHPSLVTDGRGNLAVAYETAEGAVVLRPRVNGTWGPPSTVGSGAAKWASALFVSWESPTQAGAVLVLWTEGASPDFRVNFTAHAAFPRPPPPPCTCGPPPSFAPLSVVLAAALAVAALLVVRLRRLQRQ